MAEFVTTGRVYQLTAVQYRMLKILMLAQAIDGVYF